MPRPTSKPELLAAAEAKFAELGDMIDGLPRGADQAAFAFDDRDANVRDILVHLYEWHQLLLRWEAANSAGRDHRFIPPPHTWQTTAQLNVEFRDAHTNTTLAAARDQLCRSHSDVIALIERYHNDELFTKKHFAWTGSTSLGSYCISATSSHYDWALKKLRKHRRTYTP